MMFQLGLQTAKLFKLRITMLPDPAFTGNRIGSDKICYDNHDSPTMKTTIPIVVESW